MRYRLKWMTSDGEILWIVVDGRSGEILRILPYVRRSRDPHDHYGDSPDYRHGPSQGWPMPGGGGGGPPGGPGPRG